MSLSSKTIIICCSFPSYGALFVRCSCGTSASIAIFLFVVKLQLWVQTYDCHTILNLGPVWYSLGASGLFWSVWALLLVAGSAFPHRV